MPMGSAPSWTDFGALKNLHHCRGQTRQVLGAACSAGRLDVLAPYKPATHIDETETGNPEATAVQDVKDAISQKLPDRIAIECIDRAFNFVERSVDQQVPVRAGDQKAKSSEHWIIDRVLPRDRKRTDLFGKREPLRYARCGDLVS